MISRRLIQKAEELLKRERGTVYKDPGGRLSICLVYPNTYHVGMSNLGFLGVYGLLNQRADVVCERAFLPEAQELREHKRTGSPLFSLESKRPLNRFDVVAFSVSFENDYLSIPLILELSGIPFFSNERDQRYPLLLLGGVCATANPEPLADVFDLHYIGEAEPALLSMVDVFKNAKSREDFLDEISKVEGFYVPSRYRVIYKEDGTIKERIPLNDAPLVIKKVTLKSIEQAVKQTVFTPETEFSDMLLIEAMRGCVHSCRFCLAGHIYNPPRSRGMDDLKKQIEYAKKIGVRVGLIGPSLSDYKHIKEALSIDGVNFSITSLRANRNTEELVCLFKGKRSISLAPETGNQRLRDLINKKIKDDDILGVAERVFSEDIKNLRLYFMIGLPTETDEDVMDILRLTEKIRRISRRGRITLSVSTFVPKPFTPFQWIRMAEEETVKRRLKLLKDGVKTMDGVTLLHDVPKYAYLQGVLARGDRRLSKFLAVCKNAASWKSVMKEQGLAPEFYLFRDRKKDETLPWDFIDAGVNREYLWQQYQAIL